MYPCLLLRLSHILALDVDPGKTYFLRTINIGGFVGGYIEIEDHEFTIVEVDGIYTEPFTVQRLYLSVAQRYSVLMKTKKSRDRNYLIRGQLDTGKILMPRTCFTVSHITRHV
jgi:iron transport multicopper oxidase